MEDYENNQTKAPQNPIVHIPWCCDGMCTSELEHRTSSTGQEFECFEFIGVLEQSVCLCSEDNWVWKAKTAMKKSC